MKTLTLTGDAAIVAQNAISEARQQWPALAGATDEEVLTILVGYALTMEGQA